MTSYLERYQLGEFERVWQELGALGAQVQEEPLRSDALAVARETMRRVRHNFEMLIPRLVHVGYQFGYGWIQPPPTGLFGWEQRRAYLEMLRWAKTEPPVLTVSTDVDEWIEDHRGRLEALHQIGAPRVLIEPSERCLRHLQSQPRMAAYCDVLERQCGPIPLSVRAWYEVVGGVNLIGQHPGWFRYIGTGEWNEEVYDQDGVVHPFALLEPLYVYALDEERMQRFRTRVATGTSSAEQRLPLIPNSYRAYGQVGQDNFDYEIAVPQAGADAVLLPERYNTTFVGYLRSCFRWGGFPGWEQMASRPEQDLAVLTEGLLSF